MNLQSLNVLALIPARGGSERVPHKNLRPLRGLPLIHYSVLQALGSKYINKVVVSTDSPAIADEARKAGAEVPFMRPSEIAGTGSTEFEFHAHAMEQLKALENYTPDLIVNLYPTSPFRKSETIDQAIEHFSKIGGDSLRSFRKCTEHPYKMWTHTEDSSFIQPFVGGKEGGTHTASYQMLPQVFIQNAAIYIATPATLDKFKNTVGEKVVGFEMTPEESLDINYPEDFEFAEFQFSKQKGPESLPLGQ